MLISEMDLATLSEFYLLNSLVTKLRKLSYIQRISRIWSLHTIYELNLAYFIFELQMSILLCIMLQMLSLLNKIVFGVMVGEN